MKDALNPLLEGWAKPPRSILWHYFVGLGGMGGKFRSLCTQWLHPSGEPLQQIEPDTGKCDYCSTKINLANRADVHARKRNALE